MSDKKWFKDAWAGVIPIQYARVELTSAEILALYTTPKTLVVAPGTGKVVEFISAVAFLNHGGTDYAAGGDLVVQTITGNIAVSDVLPAAEFMNLSADSYEVIQVLSDCTTVGVNDGLELTNGSAVHTTGNGTVVINVAYRIHDFN